jgi:hypothetical protein
MTQLGTRFENILELEDMVLERIKAWRSRHNNTLPMNFIVYHDGVSASQFDPM